MATDTPSWMPKVREGRIEETDTHTDTQDNYCNPPRTCVLGVNCTYCSIAAESDIRCRYLCYVFVYIVPNCSRAIMSVPLFVHCTTNYYQAINCMVCSPNALSALQTTEIWKKAAWVLTFPVKHRMRKRWVKNSSSVLCIINSMAASAIWH